MSRSSPVLTRGKDLKAKIEWCKTSTHLYLIVADTKCGHAGRYTTYQIDLIYMLDVILIGRELPIQMSRELVERYLVEPQGPSFLKHPLKSK